MSGGAGYVLSREALRRFVEEGLSNSSLCSMAETGFEDVEMGKCLENIGIRAGDSRDSKGRHRMLPFKPEAHITPGEQSVLLSWFPKRIYYPYIQVCLSLIESA